MEYVDCVKKYISMAPHKFVHWRYLLHNGKYKKQTKNPARHWLLAKAALDRMNCIYRQKVAFINPYFHSAKGDMDKAVQWMDFCVYHRQKKCMGVILFHPYNGKSGVKQREHIALAAKIQYLETKNVRYVVLRKNEGSSQVYQVLISRMFIK